MNNNTSLYSILDRVDEDGIKRECGYLEEKDKSIPVTIIGGQLVKYDSITEARSAFWDGAKRNDK